ncbi:unnamed protein product [Ixodes hexagonus]
MPRLKAAAPKRLRSSNENGLIDVSGDGDDSGCSGLSLIDDDPEDAVPFPSAPKKPKRKSRRLTHMQLELDRLLSEHEFILVGTPASQCEDRQDLFRFGQINFALDHRLDDSGDALLQSLSDCKVYIGCSKDQTSCQIIYRSTDKWLMCLATSSVPWNILRALRHRRPVLSSVRNNIHVAPRVWGTFACVIAQVDFLSICVDVFLAPSSISVLHHPADAPRNFVNFDTQDVVQHFLGIAHPRYAIRQQFPRQNFDELYTRVAAMQASRDGLDRVPQVDVQHPGLVPMLRPYQQEVVRWMLHRERQSPADIGGSFLYTTVLDDRGNALHYNAFAGFFVKEKLAFPSVARPGGILADEMGLGKTVELLACILNNPMPETDALSVSSCETEVYQTECECDIAKGAKVECFCGRFYSCDTIEETVLCPECGVYQHSVCTAMDDIHSEDQYICPQCWVNPDRKKLKAKTTLIVSPTSISFQWLEEIERHQTELSVMVYEGIQSQGFVPPTTFAKHDIVLVTYEVLKKEIHNTDLPNSNGDATNRRGRDIKQHDTLAPVTYFLATKWAVPGPVSDWSVYRPMYQKWSQNGHKIYRRSGNLYGLFLFLGEEPYNTEFWWKELLLIPYCNGNTEPLASVLSRCFKRTMKRNVLEQIGVPPQESHFHSLHFCPVEEVFYKREADKCASAFLEQVRKFPDHSAKIQKLDRHSVALLLQPLRRLRQACCHPQAVRGSCLPMRTDTMTMEELLTSLIKKTTVECEEAHRRMISAMNGIAGIYIIQDEFEEAANTYREVLWSAKDHSKNIKTDRLQQLHALHNLAQLLDACKTPSNAVTSPDKPSLTGKNGIVDGMPSHAHKASFCESLDQKRDESTRLCTESDAVQTEANHRGMSAVSPAQMNVPAICNGVSETKPEVDSTKDAACTREVLMATALNKTLAQASDPDFGINEGNTASKLPVDQTPQTRLELLLSNADCPSSSRPVDANVSELEGVRQVGTSALLASRLKQGCTPMPVFRKVSYIPQAPNDDRLEEEALKLKETYLEGYITRTTAAKEQMLQAVQAVKENVKKFSLPKSKPWWNMLLNASIVKGADLWLLSKVTMDLETQKSAVGGSLSGQVTNVSGLQYMIETQLTQLCNAREALLRAVGDLSDEPSTEELTAAVECHLRPSRKKRDKCKYCTVHEMFNLYENRLFCFTEDAAHEEAQNMDDALLTSLRRGNWGDSNLEKIIKSLCRNAAFCGDKAVSDDGALHVQLFAAFKKEFRAMRAVYMSTTDLVAALDELEMATVRLEVQLPDKTGHSSGNRKDDDSVPKPMNVLLPWEVPEQLSKLLCERELHKNDLRKKLGQLFYLQNLEKAGSSGNAASNPEPCPICQNPLGERWSVMQCGHNFCIGCVQMMLGTPACSRNGGLLCAVCRSTSAHEDIFFVDVKASKRDAPEFPVKGSHSTKTEGIVRTLLKLKAEDPTAKALVFSTWLIVIDVLRKALEDNDISYILLKTAHNFKNNLALFKHDAEVSVLLLPLSLGAKGLNLTEATHVLLIEPILNMADELQAIGRVHRIGQTK